MNREEEQDHMSCPPLHAPRTLADLRHAAGLSQEQLARRMGVGQGRISQMEARYPNVLHGTLVEYVRALGGHVSVTGIGGTEIHVDQLQPDRNRERTRASMDRSSRAGLLRLNTPASAEEQPLQGDAPEPGGDDTGGDVDQADTEGDQGDGGQRQQP